jgi:hypothetical protein
VKQVKEGGKVRDETRVKGFSQIDWSTKLQTSISLETWCAKSTLITLHFKEGVNRLRFPEVDAVKDGADKTHLEALT